MDGLISIIVTTYNRPEALDLVLCGLATQTDANFEVLVADDGSGPETKAMMSDWKERAPFHLSHVWHEDDGFRAAEIRNRGVLASRGDYCVFLDGDCIPMPGFVAHHRALAEPGWFVAGNRALLSEGLTERILVEGLRPQDWSTLQWLGQRWNGNINQVQPFFKLPLGPLRKLGKTVWRRCRGCNLAVWRSDIDRVDGFDHRFAGWGYEDSEFVVRLMRCKVFRKDGRYATGVVHLWHPYFDRNSYVDNQSLFDASVSTGRIKAQLGLSSMREDGAA